MMLHINMEDIVRIIISILTIRLCKNTKKLFRNEIFNTSAFVEGNSNLKSLP